MAIVIRKSTLINNADSGYKTSALIDRAGLYMASGTIEVAADDSANSQYRFCRIPSNANINSILLYNDALTGGTAYSVGIYDPIDGGGPSTNSAGSIASSVSYFAANINFSIARNIPLEVRYNNTDFAFIGQSLSQLLGFNSGGALPYYDIVITAITPSTVAGTISMDLRFGGF